MTGLFLRYCWRCNSTATIESNALCDGCGERTRAACIHYGEVEAFKAKDN